jgi:hypothetical protein
LCPPFPLAPVEDDPHITPVLKLSAQLLVPVQAAAGHDEDHHNDSMLLRRCAGRDYALVSCLGSSEGPWGLEEVAEVVAEIPGTVQPSITSGVRAKSREVRQLRATTVVQAPHERCYQSIRALTRRRRADARVERARVSYAAARTDGTAPGDPGLVGPLSAIHMSTRIAHTRLCGTKPRWAPATGPRATGTRRFRLRLGCAWCLNLLPYARGHLASSLGFDSTQQPLEVQRGARHRGAGLLRAEAARVVTAH